MISPSRYIRVKRYIRIKKHNEELWRGGKIRGFLCWFSVGVFSLFFSYGLSNAEKLSLRCATVAPEGTEWARVAKRVADELEQKVGVKIIWYLSGAIGDEPEIAKSLKERKIDCAALTGNGLTYLIPPMRVLELPLIFRNSEEVEKIRHEIVPLLAKIARDYKLKFIHLAEFGMVHVFSKTPIRSLEDLKGKRAWIWKGDFLAEQVGRVLQEEYNIRPVPVPLNDVSNYLQHIEILYNTFYGLSSFGWDKGVKYYITQPLTVSFIGLVISQDVFNQLGPQEQKETEEVLKSFLEYVSQMNKRNNQSAQELLRSKGMTSTTIPNEELEKLENIFQEKTWNVLKEKIYPSWLLAEILTKLSEYRARRR